MSAHPDSPHLPALGSSFSRPLAAALCLIGLAVNCAIVGPDAFHTAFQGHNDFRQFYIGAKLAGRGSFYNKTRTEEAQRETFGFSNQHLTPVRLPFYYSLLSPLARLPYRLALLLWNVTTIFAAILFVCVYPGVRKIQLAVACCWSLPLVFSTAIGQDVSFILLILAVTLRVFYAGNPLLAGLILSLCAIKFNLFLLLPLLFLGKREWRLMAGFSIGTIALLAVSFIAGPGWVGSYLALILDPAVDPNSTLMPNLHSLVANIPAKEFVEIFLSLAVIAIVWYIARHARFDVALAATLLGSILLTRHAYLQDCAILAGSLVTVFEQSTDELVRNCTAVLLLPLVYVFILIREGGVIAALFLLLLTAVGLAEMRAARRRANGSSAEALS
jgi:hypothetical protein